MHPSWRPSLGSCLTSGSKPRNTGETPRARNSNVNTSKNSSPAWTRQSPSSRNWINSSRKSGMTASSHPGVEEALELVDRLKGAVRAFTAREEKLNQEFRAKLAAVHHRHDEAMDELARRLAEEVAEADSSFRTAKEQAESRYK